MNKNKINDSTSVEVDMDGRGADLRDLDFQSYQDIARENLLVAPLSTFGIHHGYSRK